MPEDKFSDYQLKLVKQTHEYSSVTSLRRGKSYPYFNKILIAELLVCNGIVLPGHYESAVSAVAAILRQAEQESIKVFGGTSESHIGDVWAETSKNWKRISHTPRDKDGKLIADERGKLLTDKSQTAYKALEKEWIEGQLTVATFNERLLAARGYRFDWPNVINLELSLIHI